MFYTSMQCNGDHVAEVFRPPYVTETFRSPDGRLKPHLTLHGSLKASVTLIIFLSVVISFAFGYDEVTLKNGQVIRGKIIKDDESGIVIEVTEGDMKLSQSLTRDQVANVSIEEPAEYSKAKELKNRKEWLEAVKAYQQVIEVYPKYKWAELALFHKGECYEKLKDWQKTKESYERFLKDYPKSELYLNAKTGLAYSLIMQNMYGEALRIYESMLDIVKGEMVAQVHYGIGEANLGQKKYEEALEQGYLKVVVLDYDFPDWGVKAMLKGAECLMYLGDTKRAAYYYEEVLKKYPNTGYAKEAKEKLKKGE